MAEVFPDECSVAVAQDREGRALDCWYVGHAVTSLEVGWGMARERQLEEIDSEIYKNRTITVYLETFVIDTPDGSKTETGLTAQITPSDPELEWQGAYRQDLDEVFETCRDLIDGKNI